jgi:hypothetical protein
LHGQAGARAAPQQVKPGHRREGQIEGGVRLVKRFEHSHPGAGQEFVPDRLAFPDHNGIAVALRLGRANGRMESSQHDPGALAPEERAEPICFFDGSRQRGQGNEGGPRPEHVVGQGVVGARGFVVAARLPGRQRPGQREETEGGKLGDGRRPLL